VLDSFGRTYESILPAPDGTSGSPDGSGHPVTTYTYDADSNILSITDANSHATAFAYDNLNRKITITQPIPAAVHRRLTTPTISWAT